MSDNISIERKKEKAVELMTKLGIYEPYIKAFTDNGVVTEFISCFGYYIDESKPELLGKIKEFETERNAVVYAVIHSLTEFGEIYDLLFVPDYKEDWEYLIEELEGNAFYVFSYAWNATDEWCSDMGSIVVESHFGGLRRTH